MYLEYVYCICLADKGISFKVMNLWGKMLVSEGACKCTENLDTCTSIYEQTSRADLKCLREASCIVSIKGLLYYSLGQQKFR